ncbi:MAG TPA: L(+)-tartrate dehydratase subunit beta [Clostridiales bacterium UBA8153]|nr:L(+)-tartrate dehydratase subunit beta [Clostridiales bacterium UBA8153]
MKKVLRTPVVNEELEGIKIGDIVYLDGHIVTCRDVGHRRLIELGRKLPVDLTGKAIFHAGPIVAGEAGNYRMISIGPTTSMRMEKFGREFIARTGVKLVVGKGGMGNDTAAACREHKALHCVFPGGCAVLGATAVEAVEAVEWLDLGMPEALWVLRVKELGPLVVSIDAAGNNLFELTKSTFRTRKEFILGQLSPQVAALNKR